MQALGVLIQQFSHCRRIVTRQIALEIFTDIRSYFAIYSILTTGGRRQRFNLFHIAKGKGGNMVFVIKTETL